MPEAIIHRSDGANIR